MTGDIITYDYYGSLYINLTNRCDCRCVFCIRDQADSSLGGLWLQEEPKKEDVLAEILGRAGWTTCSGSATGSTPPTAPTCRPSA